MSTRIREEIVALLPHLRLYARGLVHDRYAVDDLVQETAARALRFADKFEPGTNLKAWLMTILKNEYLNEIRRRVRAVHLDIETVGNTLAVAGDQEFHLQLLDMQEAFGRLAPARRRALELIGIDGATYEDAAQSVGCAVGTIKSRVSRARLELANAMQG